MGNSSLNQFKIHFNAADWLVLRGARNLIITSRTGIKNGYQRMRVELWQSYGTKVIIVANKDASKLEDCRSIIETAAKLAPVDAIFNLAVVLKDAIWDNQTSETFRESFYAKAWSTKHLDLLTRKMCPKLRQFVVFSSVSCGRGNAGQTNYGMSNSVSNVLLILLWSFLVLSSQAAGNKASTLWQDLIK